MTPPHDPAPRRGLVLVAMTGSLSMIFVDITVVGIALPEIGGDLGLDEAGVNWVVNAYMLALAATMAIGGRLGDLFGKVRAFAIGVALFALASALCGFATTGTMLLVGRVGQGLAACLMQPASSSLVIEHFAPGERGKAMAVYVGIPMLFMSLGPALGGLIAQSIGWPWVFWINLPVAAATLLLLKAAKPRSPRSEDRAIDWLGAAILLAGLPLVVWAIQEAGTVSDDGSPRAFAPPVVGAFVAGVVLIVLFVRRQLRIEQPLLRLRLFADRQLLSNAILIGLTQLSMAALVVQGSLYVQRVLGLSPLRAGLSMLPLMLPILVLVHVSGRRYDRVGVRPVATFGTLAATIGLVVQGFGFLTEQYIPIAIGLAILGAGVAFIMSPANTDALSRASNETRGQISGLVQTFRQLGGTIGVAAAAAISIAVQGPETALALGRAAMPADSIAADETIPTPSALQADTEPIDLKAARRAFARGTAYATFAGAGAVLCGFVVARRMRPGPPPGHTSSDAATEATP
ncbi:MAG: MFS transporter [Phycisphaerales bacterium]